MNKYKKYFVLSAADKCSNVDEHAKVYEYLNKELENNDDITLIQAQACNCGCSDGCENGLYLNIIPDYIGYSGVTLDEAHRIVENELGNLNNTDNISKSIEQECYQAEQWKMFCTYLIEEEPCTGCTLCKKVCPAGAISGQAKKLHAIDQSKCIKCGKCEAKCKFKAIKIIPISNGIKALRCVKCGDLMGTVATRDYLKKKLINSINEHDLCVDCRQSYFGQALRK